MNVCKGCGNKLDDGGILACPNCGATFCENCAEINKKICPHCYNNVEYIG